MHALCVRYCISVCFPSFFRFLHGSELIGVDTLETISLRDGRTVLDRIEIHITSVQIYR